MSAPDPSRAPDREPTPDPGHTPEPAPFRLGARFATELPELATAWQGEEVPAPELLVLNEPLARELGMDPDWLRTPAGLAFLTGTDPAPLTRSVAQAYSGHQFGQFVPVLGDGRALLLGEIRDQAGVLRDIHLKGSGRTPFARGADGRAALGPVLREYLLSESLHALGVPSTRSLAVVATGRRIQRGAVVPGAVLVRVAESHIRVGSFQYANLRGGIGLTRRLADHAISRHLPDFDTPGHEFAAPGPRRYAAFFAEVVRRQAELVAAWTRLGFVHGVLNTDNTLISGATIDFGPCAFMERYRADAVYSSIDREGRYRFGNQPMILGWNMARLAETLLPLLGATPDAGMDQAQETMSGFDALCHRAYLRELAPALGFPAEQVDSGDAGAPLTGLLLDFRALLEAHAPDVTTLLRALGDRTPLPAAFLPWAARWRDLGPDLSMMARRNPVYIPRNHLVEQALKEAEAGEFSTFGTLLAAVTDPFRRRPGLEALERPAPTGFEENYLTFCGT